MKNIGIDFHVVDSLYQGSRTHVLELFAEVIKASPEFKFYLFLDKVDYLKNHSTAFSLGNVEVVKMRHTNPIKRNLIDLPTLCRRMNLDLLHTQYILPFPCPCPAVTTIHDILFETHPEYFSNFFRLRSSILMRLAARQASHVFTVSQYSKKSMGDIYNIPTDKVTVIHNGADTGRFFPGTTGAECLAPHKLRPEGYLLSVGRLEPRKNYATLLRAFSAIDNKSIPLVIIGQPHFSYDDVYSTIKSLGLADRVHVLSKVTDTDLGAFYRNAYAFLYPTWAEGFGMPTIEAMASGTPVISSNTTSIPEVVGEAAILVDPFDAKGLTNAINRIITDKPLVASLRERGLVRAMQFNWEKPAGAVKRAYQSILLKNENN